jgi:hypothetical protein
MILKFIREDGTPLLFGPLFEVPMVTKTVKSREKFNEYYRMAKPGDYQLFSAVGDDIDREGNCQEATKKIPSFRVAEFVDDKGVQRFVMFDNCLYVMNNEGKTIESFYVD